MEDLVVCVYVPLQNIEFVNW